MVKEMERTWTEDELKAINLDLEGKTPQEILEWAFKEFSTDITMACSFGGVSGMALLHMAIKVDPKVKVFYLDTDFLFPETYALKDKVAAQYGITPTGFKSLLTPTQQAAQYGEALWNRDPDLCCELRKVEPNRRALLGQRAWIAGLRRDQSETRKDVQILAWDEQNGLYKLNPMATWTEAQVNEYIAEHDIASNPLLEQGYASIGCTFCTRPVKPGEDPRAGRWAEFDKDECGIHVDIDTSAGVGVQETTKEGN